MNLNEELKEVNKYMFCRLRFYMNGQYHLGRMVSADADETKDCIWVWVKPEDPAVANPWPRVKLTSRSIVEILDGKPGDKGNVFRLS